MCVCAEEFQGTLLTCAEDCASQKSQRENGSAKGAPVSRSMSCIRAGAILWGSQAKAGPPAAPCPARTLTAVLVFFFLPPVRLSAVLSSDLRPSAATVCCLGDNCLSLYNPERLFRAHKPGSWRFWQVSICRSQHLLRLTVLGALTKRRNTAVPSYTL